MKHPRYELLINDKIWIFYPKSRSGLLDAIDDLERAMNDAVLHGTQDKEIFRIVYSVYDADSHALVDPAHPAKLLQRYDVYDVDWGDIDQTAYDQSESMDGDFDSGMASAGFGTDEDYGYFGGEDY